MPYHIMDCSIISTPHSSIRRLFFHTIWECAKYHPVHFKRSVTAQQNTHSTTQFCCTVRISPVIFASIKCRAKYSMPWRHHSCININTKIWLSSIIFELPETVLFKKLPKFSEDSRGENGVDMEVKLKLLWYHRGLCSCHWIMIERTYEPCWSCDYWDDLIISSLLPKFRLWVQKCSPAVRVRLWNWQPFNNKRNVYLQKSIECFSKEDI